MIRARPRAAGTTDLVSVGECMVELSRHSLDCFSLAFGGDTFNTAVYAARLGLAVSYATALGDDPYSDMILALAESEGIATDTMLRRPGRLPGLYVIETDAAGERRFHYWRGEAPARDLFDLPEAEPVIRAFAASRCVYFSGITLSLYSDTGLDRFARAIEAARAAGAVIAFDGNFRPRGWKGDLARARTTFARFLGLADIALPTFDDEAMLWGDSSVETTLERLSQFGISEVVVKQGAQGAVVQAQGDAALVPVPLPVTPLDTTAAGDSFNAAYLAGRLSGVAPEDSARLGHRLAGIVIGHRGAIVPAIATASIGIEA